MNYEEPLLQQALEASTPICGAAAENISRRTKMIIRQQFYSFDQFSLTLPAIPGFCLVVCSDGGLVTP